MRYLKMFGRKKQPLIACAAIHSLPGRVRLGCRALKYLDAQRSEIEERLEGAEFVHSVVMTTVTENVLIHYDAERMLESDLLELTETVVGAFSLVAYKAERLEASEQTVNERRIQEAPLSDMVGRVVATSVTLAWSWLRYGAAAPPTSFIGRFLTMPALTSLSLAIPIFRSGFESLYTRLRPNADTLSATAILASLIGGRDVSALTIIWLADIAELLTAYTMESTRRAIREMLSVGEEHVWRVRTDGTEEKVPLDALEPGDQIMVHTGEKISVDGVVVSGEASVDQASISGEFMPMAKSSEDEVFAGTVVKSGRIVIRAEKVGDQTAVARIVHLVEEAAHRKARIQAYADKFSAQFIPLNFALAIVVYAITRSFSRALNMLIIDYSCGVRLSTATALSATICTAAREGILIKGGNYLERLAEVDTLIMDKTGTLTEGRPQVTSIIPVDKTVEAEEIVRHAAAAEETSTHPMAVAVLEKARRSGWRIPEHSDTRVHVARGVETQVNGDLVRVGSRRYMQESDIELHPAEEAVHKLVRRGENVIYVAKNGHLMGVLGIEDALRENMKKALNRLRNSGMDDIVLLTGDVEQHAEIVATRMSMDRFKAEVLPEDKAETVLQLQSKGVHVVMVGDGVNDAPALAYADVGIAMGGTRTDIAMEAADITIAGDDPLMIPATINLATKTMRIVKENFAVVIGVNTLGLVLASAGVLPVFWSAVLHNACTVSVVLNSSRLLFHDIEKHR
ncbi:heavy metal translocating P-type ATPase [Thermodesulfobacteriota bacterium]